MSRNLKLQTVNKVAIIATTSAVAVSVGSFLFEFVPHTFFIKKYKEIIQMYRLGEPLPLNEDVNKLFNEVLDDLKISKKQRVTYDPFTIIGFDAYHAGMAYSRFGAIIGIPLNYTYKDRFSIDIADIRIGYDKESLNIYHPAAENLLNSIVLSDKAKKFGIAREILMSQKELVIYRSIESPIIITASIFAAELMRVKFSMVKKSVPLTIFVYATSGLFGFSLWFQIRDNINKYFEKTVDQELAALGPEYIEGGKEFYEKILQRNVALRTLLGTQGSKTYNRDGDEIFFLRQKRTPVTYRKKFFNEITFEQNQQQAA